MTWKGLIETYREFLPVTPDTPVVTLLEGNTPLLPAPRLSHAVNPDLEILLKMEGMNPTGSFKDRGMTLAISKAKESGATAVMCASTGNTSASAAAYAAKAGMRCFVLIPHGSIALGKLAQAAMHGARIVAIQGNFDQALEFVKTLTGKYPLVLVNSINPFRIQGQKTGAYEICDALGRAPDFHAIPVGNAGNITAYWAGYQDYMNARKVDRLPVMLGFQAAGAAPIVIGKPVPDPRTLATAIKIGNPASWQSAVKAARDSGGLIDAVTDVDILEAYHMLATLEGVFCEPASAASLAGVIKKSREGFFPKGQPRQVVCVLTGHGLKDPDRAVEECPKPAVVAADLEKIVECLKLEKQQ